MLGFDHMPIRDKAALEFVLHAKEAKAFDPLDVCPRTGPAIGNALCTYHNWFAAQQYQVKRLFSVHTSASLFRTFLKFRCGCHGLPINSEHSLGIPRHC